MAKMVATESFHLAGKKGNRGVTIQEGQTLDSKSPIVKANPEKFVDGDDFLEGQSRVHTYVEAATAAPGETRSVKKPKKSGTVSTTLEGQTQTVTKVKG